MLLRFYGSDFILRAVEKRSMQLAGSARPIHKLTTPLQIKHILVAQWLVTLCIVAALFVIKRELALSAVLGGLVCTLPNMYFARRLFVGPRTANAYGLLRSAYVAELTKIVLTSVLFVVILVNYKAVHPLTLFITFFLVQSCLWFVPLVTPTSGNRK